MPPRARHIPSGPRACVDELARQTILASAIVAHSSISRSGSSLRVVVAAREMLGQHRADPRRPPSAMPSPGRPSRTATISAAIASPQTSGGDLGVDRLVGDDLGAMLGEAQVEQHAGRARAVRCSAPARNSAIARRAHPARLGRARASARSAAAAMRAASAHERGTRSRRRSARRVSSARGVVGAVPADRRRARAARRPARASREQRQHEQHRQHRPVQRDVVIGVGPRARRRDDLAVGAALGRGDRRGDRGA